jgi:hypothetical protein
MSSQLRLLAAGLSLLFVTAATGCVVSGGSGGSGSAGGGGGADPVAMKVDGRDIKLDELLTSAVIRDQLRSLIIMEHVKKEAAAAGATVDQAELDKRIEEQKKQAVTYGQKWEDFLFSHGITEKEFRDQLEFSMLLEAYAEKKAAISDDELKADYEKDKEHLNKLYSDQAFLTPEQAKEVTFDKIKEWLRKRETDEKKMTEMQNIYFDSLRDVQVEFPVLGDKAKQDEWVKLIVRSKVPQSPPMPPGGKGGAPAGGQGGPGGAAPGGAAKPGGGAGQASGQPSAPAPPAGGNDGGSAPPPPPSGK